MGDAQELMDRQCARFAELDPDLPDRYLLPKGDPLMARLPGGGAAAGLVVHNRVPRGSTQSLWQATDTFELFPLLGDRPQEGMDALLGEWRRLLAEQGASATDSSCVVTWPSRDARATRALLDHGFVPLSCLAIRPPGPPPDEDTKLSGTVKVRRAEPADLDSVVELALAEHAYAALVGASVHRPGAAELKRTAARLRLAAGSGTGGDPVWLAEQDGTPIALAECGWVDPDRQAGGHRLRSGRWAYVNCVSVHEQARGGGVGRQLMSTAHDEFARAGVVGSFLYYNPPNPLSSVFWPRQGYRPLWTMWEVRPATALR
ncbi:GNAT family N-acetyltransferase [Saccharopolyspora gloriosae]|uniref:GNAT superfamily N-acetyltransferase n=1 Tax=Saccharopolyspora gloriosae TaxID=455344 RepID=A0A840NP52_9PSEU|nr:GNAT family N-acetyltransferase [Saccharopolyspora gloriosae]MBB5070872.1 GNAT superfamily N-acetyltransferase [Saccharopolyspora gloriosae]